MTSPQAATGLDPLLPHSSPSLELASILSAATFVRPFPTNPVRPQRESRSSKQSRWETDQHWRPGQRQSTKSHTLSHFLKIFITIQTYLQRKGMIPNFLPKIHVFKVSQGTHLTQNSEDSWALFIFLSQRSKSWSLQRLVWFRLQSLPIPRLT